jgi:DNA invertase Pin-like site-specific DNA recombinase
MPPNCVGLAEKTSPSKNKKMPTMPPDHLNPNLLHQPNRLRAAQYVRMSTEHQQYSTNNQADKILEYAQRRNIEIVRTYADEGKSGLSLGGRASLQKLIADVESDSADFSVVLVYDVSRWGRFQDADEAAFYEYKLKRKGILVAYVAEQFENDGSPVSTIVKGVKRAMAGEYSRELSAKVFTGQCRLIELGFRQGGPAGFGLRRVLLDQSGNPKSALQRGEHKSLQTDRVILVPGTDPEVATVNQMFQWLIQDDLAISAIANRLNAIPVLTDLDRPWTYSTVRSVLTNEKYIGNNVYNRHSFKLKKKHVDNPPDMWIRKEGAFAGVVPVDTFLTAQEILAERSRKLTDQELLEHLKRLYAECGNLSGFIINQAMGRATASMYAQRFGSLSRAYQLVGFGNPDRLEFMELNRRLRQLHPEIIGRTEQTIANLGGQVWRDPKTDLLTLNDELVISVVLARCHTSVDRYGEDQHRWHIRFDPVRLHPDLTVAIRLDAANAAELDYYLLPRLDLPEQEIRVSNRNSANFECFRFDNLNFFYGMSERERLHRFQHR